MMAITRQKAYIDPVVGVVTLRRGRVRSVSIRVHPQRGVTVTVPWLVPLETGVRFLESRREWVLAAMDRQRKRRQDAADSGHILRASDPETAVQFREQARSILPARLTYYADRYGFAPAKVFLKANRSNWGSCSAKGNINLNVALAAVPEPLRDYVILHELSHLRFRNHGPQFHALLDRLCLDALGSEARPLERQLKTWILQ